MTGAVSTVTVMPRMRFVAAGSGVVRVRHSAERRVAACRSAFPLASCPMLHPLGRRRHLRDFALERHVGHGPQPPHPDHEIGD